MTILTTCDVPVLVIRKTLFASTSGVLSHSLRGDVRRLGIILSPCVPETLEHLDRNVSDLDGRDHVERR